MLNRGNTIRDVARSAGVSIGTVSKVFNNNGRIAEATRQRVLQTAADMHFKPNALIRSLRGGQTYTIGVFVWDPKEDPTRDVTMTLSRGIAEGISLAHYDMVTYSHLPERTPETMASVFMDGRIDGVVVGPMDVDQRGIEALIAAGFPTVVLYARQVPEGAGYVAVDNAGGIAQAVRHLVELGHRKIGYYAPYYTYDYDERAESYRQALLAEGITPDPAHCVIGIVRDFSDIPSACDRFLAMADRPTALVLGDDDTALHWLTQMRLRGVRIPEELSLVGFDDVAAAATTAPGLTTLRQPAREIGRLAASYAKAMIDGSSATECRTTVPVELIVRGTTAPPGDP